MKQSLKLRDLTAKVKRKETYSELAEKIGIKPAMLFALENMKVQCILKLADWIKNELKKRN